MKPEDEPWVVSADYDELKIIFTCKKVEERDLIHKRLKWTPGFTKIKKSLEDDKLLYIKCKTEKKLDKKLAVILTTMNMIRLKWKRGQ